MFKNVPKKIKVVISAVTPLFALVILSVFAFKIGLGKISEVRAKVAAARSDLNVLQSKLNILKEAQSSVAASSNLATIALPSENPALSVISQIKSLASQNGLLVENVKSGSETKETSGLFRVDVTFDVNGPRTQIFLFLSAISNIAPISAVEKVKLIEGGGNSRATVVVKSFWADLPKALPGITQEIQDLTPDEINVLTNVSKLIQPTFIVISPSGGGGKSDPFSF